MTEKKEVDVAQKWYDLAVKAGLEEGKSPEAMIELWLTIGHDVAQGNTNTFEEADEDIRRAFKAWEEVYGDTT